MWVTTYFPYRRPYILQQEPEKQEDHRIAVTTDDCIRNCVLGIQLILNQLKLKLNLFLISLPMYRQDVSSEDFDSMSGPYTILLSPTASGRKRDAK